MYCVGDQVSLFGPDTWSGRTSPEHSAVTEGKTSKRSSKKSSKSSKQKSPICLKLSRGGGQNQDFCTPRWDAGALLGEYTTHSFGESPREGNASRLSQILEDSPLQKYSLSARACTGILNRAERRGKELPAELKEALIAQSVSRETESTEPTQPDATDADGAGGGVTPSIQSTDRECIISFQERAGKPGGAKGFSSSLSGQEPCQPSTISPFLTAGFDGTKGSKARGIGYEVEKAMTTTTSGGALPDTVGALCARDYKGIGNQYVNEGKCIVNNSLK